MKSDFPHLLTINGGSSSIRFAVFEARKRLQQRCAEKIDRIGLRGTNLTFKTGDAKPQGPIHLGTADRGSANTFLLDWLASQSIIESAIAVGHRVVHGIKHSEPERVTPKLLAELKRITPYDPDHQPNEIGLIEAFKQRYPKLPQVACFDTAFHRSMPRVAKLLPIPMRYGTKGVERYGFHGPSYSYVLEEPGRIDPAAPNGRAILAHLGSGASLAAAHDGQSIDASLGFTPTSELVMSTRTGDLGPGLAYSIARNEHMTPAHFQRMVNHESGLLGISGSSSYVRHLRDRETRDIRAAEAISLFCYQVKKWISSFATALGGLDTPVFAGGIGENAPLLRQRICDGLGFLGIALDRRRNARSAALISRNAGHVAVRVIHTDEELMIARSVTRLLHFTSIRTP